jgi:hypothetical protein
VKYLEQKDGAGKPGDDPAKELPILGVQTGKTPAVAAPSQPAKK